MPNNDIAINRQSLTTTLAQRYTNQRVGGAYNAKLAGTSTETSQQAALYDNTQNFVVKQAQGQSNFKGASGGSYKEISKYSNNLSTVRYK